MLCHEMITESVPGYTRHHMLWILEGYYERLKKHPRDADLRTKIKIMEKALEYPECGIDFLPEKVYSEPSL